MTWFYYLETVEDRTTLIRVRAKLRPSFDSAPLSYPVEELSFGRWQTPLSGEMSWIDLKELTFIGSEAA